jgi:uncharacterized membrane protein YccC
LRVDASAWRPGPAAIRFLGVALGVLGTAFLGQRAGSVLVGLGALYAGMASFGGVHAARLRRMLGTTLAATIITMLASLVSPSDVGTILAVMIGSFALSILAGNGPDLALIALQSTGVLIVLSGLPAGAAHPVGSAAFVLIGGLLQMALIALVAPIAPYAAERRAVADAWASLARYVESIGREDAKVLPDPAPFQEARTRLTEAERYGFRPEHAQLDHALRIGERLRGALIGWARSEAGGADSELIRALDTVTEGIRVGRYDAECDCPLPEGHWGDRIRQALAELRQPPGSDSMEGIDVPGWRAWLPAQSLLPDSATLRTLAFGHALRYAVALGAATAAYRTMHLAHGYWIPLSVAFVLRPDYATTLTRGLSRLFGTLAGVLVASGIVAILHPAPALLTFAMLAAVWLAFALMRVNFVIFTTVITVYVVFSLAAAGTFDPALGYQRLTATAIGFAVAIVAAFVWPTWEARKVPGVLCDTLDAQAEYGEAILARTRGEGSAEAVHEAHRHARTLGVEAQRVIDAAGLEPRWGQAEHLDQAPDTLAFLLQNAAEMIALDVELVADPTSEEAARRLVSANTAARERRDRMGAPRSLATSAA